jgi:hypothetical protein
MSAGLPGSVGPDDFQTYFEEDLGLFAVARLAPPSRTIDEGGNPPAEYLVILGVRDDTRGIARTFLIDGENVVRSTLGCQQTPRESLAAAQANGDIVQLVVAPPD